MRHDVLHLDEKNADLIAYSIYSPGTDNRREIERMKRILSRAVRSELTARQRECLTLYYLHSMKMRDIARALSISPSTVTRHIKAAKARLTKIAKYYE